MNITTTTTILFLLIITSPIPILSNSQLLYNPTENIALDCGSPANATTQDRGQWLADTTTATNYVTLLDQNHKSSLSTSAEKQSSQISRVPYLTARISSSNFTYVFPLSPGQKFIRFHFYPSQYPNFNPANAFFSVTTNGFTLLRNFSAALTSAYLNSDYLISEFCIGLDNGPDQTLNITFTPSPFPSNSYAFINGIEIVSMPTNLYYTSPESQNDIIFIGHGEQTIRIENNTALETVHRLNVGGRFVSPVYDTGMFRRWVMDDDYVNNIGALPVNETFEPIFDEVPNYTAPAEIYRTARSMGNNKTVNKNYNLTWNLGVDSGFTYLVRLHFCEFQKQVTKQSDREFTIYIANQTALNQFDVIVWAGGRNQVPVKVDFAVMMEGKGTEKKQNLSIALHPNPDSMTVYSDAILNGIEVFKISDYSSNLAGPNPDPIPAPASPVTPLKKPQKQRINLYAAVVGGVFGALAVSVFGFLIFRRRRRRGQELGSSKMGGPLLPSELCRRFSFAEIKTATNEFHGDLIIGRGGFGDVYKGFIDDGNTPVAIKRLKQGSQQGVHEFMTEIEMLSQLRHAHLVSLIGYCNDEKEMILVYDYMSRGTLRDHLYDSDNPPLSWNQRLQICIGSAQGLHYLHAGAKHRVIHRDVKTTNILLDDKWVAKVADFGLSKVHSTDISNAHISTVVKGSFGYLDPEYFRRQQLSEKSDVYSFGVVLFEVLCGRPPVSKLLERDQISLAGWARKCYQNGTLGQIVDPRLKGQIGTECLKRFAEIAVSCLNDEGIKRPPMNEVVWTLEFAMQLQVSEDVGIKIDGADQVGFEKTDLNRRVGVMGSSSNSMTMTSDGGISFTTDGSSIGAVFSEINNPSVR